MKIYVSPTNQTGNTYSGIATNEGVQMNRVAIAMHAELQSYVVDLKLGDYTKRMWETNAAGALIGGRIHEAKQWGADYYFEIHSDATGVHNYGVGASCYYRPNATIKTKLANTFVNELNRICPYPKNRGGVFDGYAKGYLAIRHSENAGMAGFLIETNFHDNPNVAKWIVDNVTLIGKTLASAAAKELGLKKKVDPTPTPTPTPQPPATGDAIWRVQIGAWRTKSLAETAYKRLKADGYDAWMYDDDGIFRVQAGAFAVRSNADQFEAALRKKGYQTWVIQIGAAGPGISKEPVELEIKVGDRVTVNKGATDILGGKLASFVFNITYTVMERNGARVVFGLNGVITAAVDVKYLTKV